MSAVNENVLFQIQDETNPPVMEETVESRKYLIFITDDLRLGVDAEYVVEILNTHTATYLPMMPDYIRGIFNMRGQIIPIMDIRLRLGKPPMESESLDIPNASILPIPSQSAQKLVSGMCTLPDGSGTMLVLDCDQLIPHE